MKRKGHGTLPAFLGSRRGVKKRTKQVIGVKGGGGFQ